MQKLVTFIDRMQKIPKRPMGFLPMAGIQYHVEKGRVIVRYDNGDPVAYLLHGALHIKRDAIARIFQVSVHPDYRGGTLVHQMLGELVQKASDCANSALQVRVRENVPGHGFWKRQKFQLQEIDRKKAHRKPVYVYRRELV